MSEHSYSSETTPFSPHRLRSLLKDCRLGNPVLYEEETTSTNTLAKQAIQEQTGHHGWLAIADHQTQGRGRRGNAWSSPKGTSLLFSLVLRPQLPLDAWPKITIITALSVCKMIDEWVPGRAQIKWPNDVWVDGKKICGILAESLFFKDQAHFILGVGINVNQTEESFSSELRGQSTSLKILAHGKIIDRTEALALFLTFLNQHLFALESGEWNALREEIGRRSCLLGQWITWQLGDQTSQGFAETLDEEGHLVVVQANGHRQVLVGVDHIRPLSKFI